MLSNESEKAIFNIKLRLVTRIWSGVTIFVAVALPASLLRAFDTGWLAIYSFHLILALYVATVYCLKHRLSLHAQSTLLIGLFIAIGSSGVAALGLLGAGIWWLVVSSLLIYILYSTRAGMLSVLGTLAFIVLCGALYVNGVLTLPVDANDYIVSSSSWATQLVAVTLMPVVVFQAIGVYQESVVALLNKAEIQHAEIQRVAMHDQLTNLATLNLTQDRFEVASSLATRADKKVALLFIDLDGFKAVNDTHGHEAGDIVLVEIARRLKRLCRSEDTASRAGGDEFMLLLSNIETPEEACDTATRVVKALQEPILFNQEKLQVGASVGVSLFPDHAENLKLLRKKADQAMYQVKKSGKNSYQLYRQRSGDDLEA